MVGQRYKRRPKGKRKVGFIKRKDQKDFRFIQAEKQDFYCGLCCRDLVCLPIKKWHLDHNHKTGYTRAVLCSGCNRAEGKIFDVVNRMLSDMKIDFEEFASRLVRYWDYHNSHPSFLLHPKHKTKNDKRIKRLNKKKKKEK